jgi:uncharacterized coiled-coil protein SlyX
MDIGLEELKRKLRNKHYCLDEIAELTEKAAHTIERLQEEMSLLANDLRIYQQAVKKKTDSETPMQSGLESAHEETPSDAQ